MAVVVTVVVTVVAEPGFVDNSGTECLLAAVVVAVVVD